MYTSVNKTLFDFIINKLNANTQGVTFSGNYIFRFWQQAQGIHNFEIIQKAETGLDYESIEVVPVVDLQTIEVPFVEQNKRSDWEKQFYIAIEIGETINEFNQRIFEFDETNSKYQAILETLDGIREQLTYTEGDYKYTFKTKEPVKVNVFKFNSKYYQLFSLTFNMTSVQKGYFGNELKLYFGRKDDINFTTSDSYKLDFTQCDFVMSKEVKPAAAIASQDQKQIPNKRTIVLTVTVNLTGSKADVELIKEIHALVESTKTLYNLRVVNTAYADFLGEDLNYIMEVTVVSGSIPYSNNSLDKITVSFERG